MYIYIIIYKCLFDAHLWTATNLVTTYLTAADASTCKVLVEQW